MGELDKRKTSYLIKKKKMLMDEDDGVGVERDGSKDSRFKLPRLKVILTSVWHSHFFSIYVEKEEENTLLSS